MAAALLLAGPPLTRDGAQQAMAETTSAYLVLVNANNRTSTHDGDLVAMVKGLYLKTNDHWPNGRPSTPLSRPNDNAAQKAFQRLILHLDSTELSAHWQQLASETGRQPPQVVRGAKDLVRVVAQNQDAFGVIKEGEVKKLPAKVRVLFKFSPPDPAGPLDQAPTAEIAELHDYMVRHNDQVRGVVTDFNRASDESRFQHGEVALINGYQVLLRYADMYVLRLSYTWNEQNSDKKLTDDYLIQFGGNSFDIVERVTEQ
ncbi:MAG: hypothetical protein AAF495_28715 [Pseudomonadota bacterium]